MNYKELAKRLKGHIVWGTDCKGWEGYHPAICDEAAAAIEALIAELEEERYRHDRLQDFEIAESQQLAYYKEAARFALDAAEPLLEFASKTLGVQFE